MENKRLNTFDFLRGFFVILALLEHYTYYINVYFLKYYNAKWFDLFQYNFTYSGHGLEATDSLVWLMKYFGAWVSQIYIALACFNLGKSSDHSLEKMKKRNFQYLFLFSLFSIEQILVSSNISDFLSIHPLQVWMIVLCYFNTARFYLGHMKTISWAVLFGITPFISVTNEPFQQLNFLIQDLIGSDASIECRPQIFFISSAIGFYLGYIYNFKRELTQILIPKIILGSLIFLILFGVLSPIYPVNPFNLLRNEYSWSYNILGSLTIWSTITFCISLASFLELKNKTIRLPLINHIGVDSLWYFLFHRIFFISLYMPLRILTANLFNIELENTLGHNFLAIGIYTVLFYTLSWILLRTKTRVTD